MAGSVPPVSLEDFDNYLLDYVQSKPKPTKIVLLLDYDGTLSPIVAHADLAVLPGETREGLEKLAKMESIFLGIVSGRNVANVKKLVGIDNITYAGNHGLEILHPDGTKYVHPMPQDYSKKVDILLAQLQNLSHDGAWVENKGTILTFHYRETPLALQEKLIEQAEALMLENGFTVGKGHCVLEARPPVHWNKGQACLHILKTTFNSDWSEKVCTIYAGDDVTDEDAMEALKGMSVTFRVTSSNSVKTSATHLLPSTKSVLTMLKWIERQCSK